MILLLPQVGQIVIVNIATLYGCLGRNKKIIGFSIPFADELALGIDREAIEIRALNYVEIFSSMLSPGTGRAHLLVNGHCIKD